MAMPLRNILFLVSLGVSALHPEDLETLAINASILSRDAGTHHDSSGFYIPRVPRYAWECHMRNSKYKDHDGHEPKLCSGLRKWQQSCLAPVPSNPNGSRSTWGTHEELGFTCRDYEFCLELDLKWREVEQDGSVGTWELPYVICVHELKKQIGFSPGPIEIRPERWQSITFIIPKAALYFYGKISVTGDTSDTEFDLQFLYGPPGKVNQVAASTHYGGAKGKDPSGTVHSLSIGFDLDKIRKDWEFTAAVDFQKGHAHSLLWDTMISWAPKWTFSP